MAAGSLPQMLSGAWFWLAVIAGLLVVLHLARKRYPRPSPMSHESPGRYRKIVVAVTDALLIGTILMGCTVFVSAFRGDFRTWRDPLQPQAIREVSLCCLFVEVVAGSGILGPLISSLSFFQSNLTKFKRVVLLILCLLPALFAAPAVLTSRVENRWLMVLLGVVFSVPAWIENGPSILIGQPLFQIVWRIMRKLHLVSGDVPD